MGKIAFAMIFYTLCICATVCVIYGLETGAVFFGMGAFFVLIGAGED